MTRTQQLDSTIRIVTPENIAFQHQVAGPFERLPAFVVDTVLQGFALGALVILGLLLSTWFGFASVSFFLLGKLVLDWFYGGLFETFMNGQTPGKRWLGLRVLTADGQPITGMQAILRNIFRAADTMPLLSLQMLGLPAAYIVPTYFLGLIATGMNPRFQRIGDLVAGTMVVVDEQPWSPGVLKFDDPRVEMLANELPVHLQLSRSTVRALSMYVDRRRHLSVGRRHEVARHLAEPYIERLGLPPELGYDLLLCALYQQVFGRSDPTPQAGQPVESSELVEIDG